ncbi:MAG: hypothetical protein ACR5KV_05310 [Wolbachia sp.]
MKGRYRSSNGLKDHVGKSGLNGGKRDTGSIGKDGIGTAEANQFLHEIKKQKMKPWMLKGSRVC